MLTVSTCWPARFATSTIRGLGRQRCLPSLDSYPLLSVTSRALCTMSSGRVFLTAPRAVPFVLPAGRRKLVQSSIGQWDDRLRWSTARCSSSLPSSLPLLRKSRTEPQLVQYRGLRLSAPCQLAFPPLIAAVIRVVGKPAAVLVGRYARKKWAEVPPEDRQRYFSLHKHKLGVAAALFALFAFVYYEMHVEETPFTKRRRFMVFNQEQFAQITEQQRNMILESMKDALLPTKHPAYKQVNRVAMRLIKSNTDIPLIRDQKWSVTLIGNKEKNAFVLPSGHIFVFLGMLEMVGNDDQLGVVLGHEMAHAVLGHGMEQVSVMHFVDYIVIVLMSVLWAILPSDVISGITTFIMNKVVDLLLHLPYGRLLESEADDVGLMISAKACFDVRESVAFWERMQMVSEFEGDVAAQIPEFLSTHPSHSNRAQTLSSSVPKALEIRKECNCPPLPARHPANDVARLKAVLEKSKSVDDPWKPYIVVLK